MNDGGPAFATPHSDAALTTGQEGMSLLDWFAGQALSTITDMKMVVAVSEQFEERPLQTLARIAYDYADAMIAERERRK